MNPAIHNRDYTLPHLRILQTLTALLTAVILQTLLVSSDCELPQREGDSVLTLISQDTRMVLSAGMLKKVDEYFHGGVKVHNCGLNDHDHDHEQNHKHAHSHSHDSEQSRPEVGKDPFRWINRHIHVQEHRHLQAARSVELLPWVYAATKTSPHNIMAYESGSYILSDMLNNPRLAVEYLKEGIAHNPASVHLEMSLGELYYNKIKDTGQALTHFQRALNKSIQIDEPDDDDLFMRLRIFFYLGNNAWRNGDAVRLQNFYQKACELWPKNSMTLAMKKWLDEMKAGK
jgi:hypothetical protein